MCLGTRVCRMCIWTIIERNSAVNPKSKRRWTDKENKNNNVRNTHDVLVTKIRHWNTIVFGIIYLFVLPALHWTWKPRVRYILTRCLNTIFVVYYDSNNTFLLFRYGKLRDMIVAELQWGSVPRFTLSGNPLKLPPKSDKLCSI